MSERQRIIQLLESKYLNREALKLHEISYVLKYIKNLPLTTLNNGSDFHILFAILEKGRLTKRQLHIFKLIGQGLQSKEIAKQLDLSINTITTHRKNIIKRLKLQGAGQLPRVAQKYYLYRKN